MRTAAADQLHNSASRALLDRRFEAIVFDWDGTAVPDRGSDATRLGELVESACALGLHLVVISGTHVANVDPQLGARPTGPGTLHLLLNRGRDAYAVGSHGPRLLERRPLDPAELECLDEAAERTRSWLDAAGLRDAVVVRRPNRVKIDLIPEAAWSDPPKARIAELLAAVQARLREHGIADLAAVTEAALRAAFAVGLEDPRVTTDAKNVEIGLTDKSDSARWAFGMLWRLGISPAQVLICGDEFGRLGGLVGSDSLLLIEAARRSAAVSVGVEPDGVPAGVVGVGGGPDAFLGLLDDQIRRRRAWDLPEVDDDPAWALAVDGADSPLERAYESCMTLADGRIGTRGSVVASPRTGAPAVRAAGVYRGAGPESELLESPLWNQLAWQPPAGAPVRRVLDLHSGLLREELGAGEERLEAVLLSSSADPGTTCLRATSRAALEWGPPLTPPPLAAAPGLRGEAGGLAFVPGDPGGVAVAASQHESHQDGIARVERLATYCANARRRPSTASATAALASAQAAGFERLLNAHRARLGERWEEAGIEIDGDPELERALRFCLFHLMTSVADHGEAAVGARGLTGAAYRGHVFWDADVFVLPFLAATHPAAARAMLEYRLRRLPAARAAAQAEGTAGAHFPWESAAGGDEVAPTRGRDRLGRVTAIRTGDLEEHIVADIAWAACCYADWTGDTAFLSGPGRGLVLDSARWWATRIERDADGSAHIRGVIGPDEYHGPVDDNAFTNVMARWNLRRAIALSQAIGETDTTELRCWQTLADALVDGYDESTRIYEQFAGFHALEPLVIAEVTPRRPVAATLLLGAERVAGAQVVKQADVLMLHHLVPDEVTPGSLVPNLHHYEPRTAHGSSLSPGVHASLLARADRLDEARDLLLQSARIDLDDVTATTAGGVHLASMGASWQALAFGFAGLRPGADVLEVAPRLPVRWRSLAVPITFRGTRLRLRFHHDHVEVEADRPVRIRLDRAEPVRISPGRTSLALPERTPR